MRALLFALIALTLALSLAPTDPPVPKAAVVEAPPPANHPRELDLPGFPEYRECIWWINQVEWEEGRQGYTIRRLAHTNDRPRGTFACIVIRSSDATERWYQFDFFPDGRLRYAQVVSNKQGHIDIHPPPIPPLPPTRHSPFP